MSYSIDVNLLLYASDRSGVWQEQALSFLADCASRPELLCIGWPTVMSYLRIATHPKIFEEPLSPDEARANVESLLGLPNVRLLAEDDRFWATYRRVCNQVAVRANLVPDAHLAALLLHHGVRVIYTKDRDFRKFDFLESRDPLPAA